MPAADTRRRAPPASPRCPGTSRETEYYDAGFDAFWELDFFGGVRRGLEASTANLGAIEAAQRDVLVTVTAEVTRTYFELRGFQQQLDVARRNVVNQKATLDLAQARLDAGSGTEFDTARAQAQLSGTLGTIGPLEAAVARAIHRLSVLVGREPGALRAQLAPPQDLPPLPGVVPVGDPAGTAASAARHPHRRARARRRHRARRRRGRGPLPARDLHGQRRLRRDLLRRPGRFGVGCLRARPRHLLGHLRSRPRPGAHRRGQGAQRRRPAAI